MIAKTYNISPLDVLEWPNSFVMDILECIDLSSEAQDRYEADMEAKRNTQ